jgi:hypothetical protein
MEEGRNQSIKKMKYRIITLIIVFVLLPLSTWAQTQKVTHKVSKRPTTSGVSLTPQERKIVGKHLYGANFHFDEETGEGLGTLTITKQKDGRLRCKGTHRTREWFWTNKPGDYGYVNLDGYVEIINADKIVFDGTINYNIPGYNTGDQTCKGRFLFETLYEGGAYWRDSRGDGYSEDYKGSSLDIFKKVMR